VIIASGFRFGGQAARAAYGPELREAAGLGTIVTTLSMCPQLRHSKVKISNPRLLSGDMRAKPILVEHFGQGGRSIGRGATGT
jgi:hypothetical protein